MISERDGGHNNKLSGAVSRWCLFETIGSPKLKLHSELEIEIECKLESETKTKTQIHPISGLNLQCATNRNLIRRWLLKLAVCCLRQNTTNSPQRKLSDAIKKAFSFIQICFHLIRLDYTDMKLAFSLSRFLA